MNEKFFSLPKEKQKAIINAAFRENIKHLNFDPEQFIPGIDPKMMYLDMYWASEGYLWEKLQGVTWMWTRWSGIFSRSLNSGRKFI